MFSTLNSSLDCRTDSDIYPMQPSDGNKFYMCTSATRCDTMRNTFSSIRVLQGSNALCRTSTAKTTMTLSSPSSPQEWSVVATASAKTSLWRSSRSPKKTFSNTVPMAPMPSTPSISAAKSSHSTIYIQLRLVECDNCYIFVASILKMLI